jgi:glycerophosphoryl diester phosphodiesterase
VIFKHRQNDSTLWNKETAVEFDVRLHEDRTVILSHDPIGYDIDLDFTGSIGDVVYDRAELPKMSIVNVKTSGAEEYVAGLFNEVGYGRFYFLDSQIPDILRLSKEPEFKGRFIIRVSDVESYNEEFMKRVQPKYIWADWSQFDNFDPIQYDHFINTLTRQISDDQELIIVSPELYNIDYENLIPTIAEIITRHGHSSACTKNETQWEALLAKSK